MLDRYGLPVSTSSAVALRHYTNGVDALLASGPAEIAEFQRNLRPQKSGAGVPPLHRTTRPTKPKATGRAWEALPPPA